MPFKTPFYSLALSFIYSMHLVNIYFFSVLLIYHDIIHRMDKQYFFKHAIVYFQEAFETA